MAIRVVIAGPDGRMGRAMVAGLPTQDGIEVTGGLRRSDDDRTVASTLAGADVLVDFTHAGSARGLMLRAIAAGIRPVSGTSGVTEDDLRAIDAAARERGMGAVWAANFRLMGVLLAHLARTVARYIDSAEIIEAHHARKADAPSGTARELARLIREAHGATLSDPPVRTETLAGVRGGVHEGVRVHSLRLPDLQPTGWHEVIFTGGQEMLTIRHDDWGYEAYAVTVGHAVRKVMQPEVVGLIRGYDAVIGLGQ
jgi:4-hydroxy-tetrahydrodipicolinate reductase